MIQVKCGPDCRAEKDYIFRVLLQDFLGLPYVIRFEDRAGIELAHGGKSIILDDGFFRLARDYWLQERSLPRSPLPYWTGEIEGDGDVLVDREIPILYGTPQVKIEESRCEVGIDIFGSCFFMLSRYEEVVRPDRDRHERFPAEASIAYQAGFLERPIVNEYVEILWACCRVIWPTLERKQREFRIRVTADVDEPYSAGVRDWRRQLRHSVGDVVKRKSIRRSFSSVANYFNAQRGDFSLDRHLNMFDWMMDVNERARNTVEFYFMAGRTDEKLDGNYSIREPVIRRLLRRIHERGHVIGLHPSYRTFRSATRLQHEVAVLKGVLEEEGIQQHRLGGRQHFLRWDPAVTAKNWNDAGLDYDSSLGFAEFAGFRCGTCYEYQLYDVVNRSALDVREHPLVAMEVTFFNKNYMGLGIGGDALERMRQLKEICREFGGEFVLLWHNSTFPSEVAKEMYADVCSGS